MKYALYLAVFLVAYVFAGTMDYNDQKAAADERAEQATVQASRNEARIWSKKCMAQGKQILATQADGGKWKIKCVSASLKA